MGREKERYKNQVNKKKGGWNNAKNGGGALE